MTKSTDKTRRTRRKDKVVKHTPKTLNPFDTVEHTNQWFTHKYPVPVRRNVCFPEEALDDIQGMAAKFNVPANRYLVGAHEFLMEYIEAHGMEPILNT